MELLLTNHDPYAASGLRDADPKFLIVQFVERFDSCLASYVKKVGGQTVQMSSQTHSISCPEQNVHNYSVSSRTKGECDQVFLSYRESVTRFSYLTGRVWPGFLILQGECHQVFLSYRTRTELISTFSYCGIFWYVCNCFCMCACVNISTYPSTQTRSTASKPSAGRGKETSTKYCLFLNVFNVLNVQTF